MKPGHRSVGPFRPLSRSRSRWHGDRNVSPDGDCGNAERDRRVADAAVMAIRWLTRVPEEQIRIAVAHGQVTLRGTVQNRNQKKLLEEVVRKQPEVKKISNRLRIRETPGTTPPCRVLPFAHNRQLELFEALYDGPD